MLQTLGNLAGYPWLCSGISNVCFDSFESSLIVSEKSKSMVFLGYMKSTNLLCSVVPNFLNSRRTFFYKAIVHSLRWKYLHSACKKPRTFCRSLVRIRMYQSSYRLYSGKISCLFQSYLSHLMNLRVIIQVLFAVVQFSAVLIVGILIVVYVIP